MSAGLPEAIARPLSMITIRGLRPDDLERVIALDARNTGRRREEFFGLNF